MRREQGVAVTMAVVGAVAAGCFVALGAVPLAAATGLVVTGFAWSAWRP